MARRGSLGRSVLDLDVDDSKFTSGLDRNRRKARGWTDSLSRDVKKGLGQGLGIGAGLGVAMAVEKGIGLVKDVVAGSISAAMEWESAMAGVAKTVEGTDAEIDALGDSLVDMSEEMPIAAGELAGLAEAAGALGVAKDDILEFVRVTAMIGTTTDVSADDAATSLGQLSNVLGLTSQDYERFGSTLVDLGNKGASTESQILQIASRAGAGSKLIGMATDQTLGWASAVANLGIEVEAGGSALQKFFLDSTKAVSEGGDKLETYARIAGVTGAEFKRAFEEDASGALQLFLAGLGELTQGEQLAALADLDFNDVRITRTLLGLANGTDMVTASLDTASVAWEENIAMAKEAEKRYGTTESKLTVLGNRVNNLAAEFGENLLPAIVTVATVGVDELAKFAKEVGDLVQFVGYSTQTVAGHFGDMGDATNKLADDMDRDFGEVNDAIARYMSETGATFDDALEAVRLYGTGNIIALQESGAAWESYTKTLSGAFSGVPTEVTGALGDTEAALLAGEEGIDGAAGTALDGISAEAQKQRDAAVKAMSDMLAGITGMFETDESVREAMQGLLDRMDDPYTEAERKADIFSTDTIGVIKTALDTDDPGAVGATTDFVNRMLNEFALMEPGALESGDAVPPAMKEGMDAQMGALISWIETNVTGESLAAMEIDAVPQGLEGIASYARGMARNERQAVNQAAIIASRAVNQLNVSDTAWAGGYATGAAFMNGITAAFWAKNPEVVTALNYMRRQLGGSLPEIGPLAGDTAERGGASVGDAWTGALAHSLDPAAVDRALSGIASSMDHVGLPMPSMPGLDLLSGAYAGAALGGSNAGGASVTYIYNLNVNGKPIVTGTREDVLEAWEREGRFSPAGVGVRD